MSKHDEGTGVGLDEHATGGKDADDKEAYRKDSVVVTGFHVRDVLRCFRPAGMGAVVRVLSAEVGGAAATFVPPIGFDKYRGALPEHRISANNVRVKILSFGSNNDITNRLLLPDQVEQFLSLPSVDLRDVEKTMVLNNPKIADTLIFRCSMWQIVPTQLDAIPKHDRCVYFSHKSVNESPPTTAAETSETVSVVVNSARKLRVNGKAASHATYWIVARSTPPGASFSVDDAFGNIAEGIVSDANLRSAIADFLEATKPRPGYLKSLVQKIIRTRAKSVEIPVKGGKTALVDGAAMLKCAWLFLLFKCPGSFLPHLQRFVSGAESATKRLVVSCVEDGYTCKPETLMRLMGLASVYASNATVGPEIVPFWLIHDALQLCDELMASPAFWEYRKQSSTADGAVYKSAPVGKEITIDGEPGYDNGIRIVGNDVHCASTTDALVVMAATLEYTRSFESDIDMAWSVAANPIVRRHNDERLEVLRAFEANDQHANPNVAYWVEPNPSRYRQFRSVMSDLWDLSGVRNPRKICLSAFAKRFAENASAVASINSAMRHSFNASFPPVFACPPHGTQEVIDILTTTDPATQRKITTEVSPLHVYGFVFTTLKLSDVVKGKRDASESGIFEATVCLRRNHTVAVYPNLKSRGGENKSDNKPDPALSKTTEQALSAQFLAMLAAGLRINIPVDSILGKVFGTKEVMAYLTTVKAVSPPPTTAKESEATQLAETTLAFGPVATPMKVLWKSKELEIETVVHAVKLPPTSAVLHELKDIRRGSSLVATTVTCFHRELRTVDSILANHIQVIRTLVQSYRDVGQYESLCRRFGYYLASPRTQFELNGLSRDGSGTKYATTTDDITLFYFLLRLCIIAPVAVRYTGHNAEFTVNWILLQHILSEGELFLDPNSDSPASQPNKALAAKGAAPSQLVLTRAADVKPRSLFAHQVYMRDALLSKFIDYKERAGCLWATQGSGKTHVIASVLDELDRAGKLPEYTIYLYPRIAVEAILAEFRLYGFTALNQMNFNKTARKANAAPNCSFIRNGINFVEHDDARKIPEDVLQGKRYIIIGDEIHRALDAKTLRTNAFLKLIKESHLSIVMTGTLIKNKNLVELLPILRECVPFQLDLANIMTAFAEITCVKLGSDVLASPVHIKVPLDVRAEHKKEFESLAPLAMGGVCHTAPNVKRAFDLLYLSTTLQMCEDAVAMVRGPVATARPMPTTKTFPDGVVIVVLNRLMRESAVQYLRTLGVAQEEILELGAEQTKSASLEPIPAGHPNPLFPKVKFFITRANDAVGYSAHRFGAMLTAPYPVSSATSQQMEGRINRVGSRDVRSEVHYFTYVCGYLNRVFQSKLTVEQLIRSVESNAVTAKF